MAVHFNETILKLVEATKADTEDKGLWQPLHDAFLEAGFPELAQRCKWYFRRDEVYVFVEQPDRVERARVLAENLEMDPFLIVPRSKKSPNLFDVTKVVDLDKIEEEFFGTEYLVVTDEEADVLVRERIRNSAWAFKAYFLSNHITSLTEQQIKRLRTENGNDELLAAMDDVEDFENSAISANGRSFHLSADDQEEYEEVDGTRYYIYCQG